MKNKDFILFSRDDSNDDDVDGGHERRRHKRYRIGVLTEIEVDGEKRTLPGITFNVSRSGAYLLTLAPLETAQEVTLKFVAEESHETVKGRVVHGTELEKKVFWSQGVGIEFIESMPRFFAVQFDELIDTKNPEEE